MFRSAFVLIGLTVFSQSWGQDEIKCNDAGTQLELNACAADDFDRADKELNETYAALLKKKSDSPDFIRKLRAAQRAWIAFRDAEIEATFACDEKDPRICWGSMLPMCYSSFKAELTRARTARLREFLDDSKSPDHCH